MHYSFAIFAGLSVCATQFASAQSGHSASYKTDLSVSHNQLRLNDEVFRSSDKRATVQLPSTTSLANAFETEAFEDRKAFSAQFDFAGNDDEPGFRIEPHFEELTAADNGFSSYSAEIRLGNFVTLSQDRKPSGWYIFAASDGEAISVQTDTIMTSEQNMAVSLDDQITIGDIQAGISTYYGDTQLTFSYMESEASYSARGMNNVSKKEAFAGVSLAKRF